MSETLELHLRPETPLYMDIGDFVPHASSPNVRQSSGTDDELVLDISSDSGFDWPDNDPFASNLPSVPVPLPASSLGQEATAVEVLPGTPVLTPEHERVNEILKVWISKSNILEGYASQRLGDTRSIFEARDIIQGVYERFIRSYGDAPPEFQDGDGMSFLFAMLGRGIVDAQRSIGRLQAHERVTGFDGADAIYLDSAMDSSSEQSLFDQTGLEAFRKAILALAPKFKGNAREMLDTLIAQPEISNKELEGLLDLEASSIRVVRKRVLDKLFEGLRDYSQSNDIGFAADFSKKPDRKSGNSKETKKTRISPSRLQSGAVKWLAGQMTSEEQSGATIYVPSYIGLWSVAARGMREYYKHISETGGEQPGPGIFVYPNKELLPELRTFIRQIAGNSRPFIVDTPENVNTLLKSDGRMGYVVLAEQTSDISSELSKQLERRSAFLLRLLERPVNSSQEGTFMAAEYGIVGRKNIEWGPDDSIRYLKEWRFATGHHATRPEIEAAARSNQGPSLKRLLSHVGSFAALSAAAGYSYAVEAKKPSSPATYSTGQTLASRK